MTRSTLLLTTILGLATLPAFAQDAAAPADTDGNGTWSLAELQASYADLTEEGFTSIDANTDGAVDQAELAAAMADGLLPAVQ